MIEVGTDSNDRGPSLNPQMTKFPVPDWAEQEGIPTRLNQIHARAGQLLAICTQVRQSPATDEDAIRKSDQAIRAAREIQSAAITADFQLRMAQQMGQTGKPARETMAETEQKLAALEKQIPDWWKTDFV